MTYSRIMKLEEGRRGVLSIRNLLIWIFGLICAMIGLLVASAFTNSLTIRLLMVFLFAGIPRIIIDLTIIPKSVVEKRLTTYFANPWLRLSLIAILAAMVGMVIGVVSRTLSENVTLAIISAGLAAIITVVVVHFLDRSEDEDHFEG